MNTQATKGYEMKEPFTGFTITLRPIAPPESPQGKPYTRDWTHRTGEALAERFPGLHVTVNDALGPYVDGVLVKGMPIHCFRDIRAPDGATLEDFDGQYYSRLDEIDAWIDHRIADGK